MQTPTLALVAAPRAGDPRLQARSPTGSSRRSSPPPASASTAAATWAASGSARRRRNGIVADCAGRPGTITKLEKKEEREAPQLLYDLTSLQRHANTLYGFSARRTLAAAQRLYEEHKAITYPRTSSRFLTSDMIGEIKPTAGLVGKNERYARAAAYVTGLDKLPLGRVVNDKRSRTTTRSSPRAPSTTSRRWARTRARIYDLVARRFLAVFHPDAVYERTRVETTVAEHVFRTSGRVLIEAGWKSVYGEEAQNGRKDEDDSGGDQLLPPLQQGEEVETRSVDALRKETQPPRRYSEASLLSAMETAGKDVQDAELREAMKDSGIGTPATRAAIIERLIQVGYLEREGRALHATEKGIQVISLLGEHPLTSAALTGNWEHRLGLIEQGEDTRPAFMSDIVKFTPGHRRRAGQAQGRAD